MTGVELEKLCIEAAREAGEGEDPLEGLLRLMLRSDPQEGHHRFAKAVDRLHALAPELTPGEAVRGVARGEIALPSAWIGRPGPSDAGSGIEVTLDGISLTLNGKTVELGDATSLQTLAEMPGVEIDGAQVSLDSAHVVTQVNVQDEQGNVQQRVILDGEEIDPAELEERLAGLPEDVRKMLLERDEEPGS